MKIARKVFAFFLLCCAQLILFSSAQTPQKTGASSHYLAYVGTYTAKTNSKGIYAYRYDAAAGQLSPIGLAAESADPSFLAVHPSGKFLYAVNEAGKSSTVSAFQIDYATGKLALLNQVSALGEDPCYISLDRTGKYVFVANYSTGNVVVFPIGPDGKLGDATSNVQDSGALGPNKERQQAPHAHWIEASPDNRLVYVADLALDRILIYGFDAANGTLSAWPPSGTGSHGGHANDVSVRLAPGAGPRHAVVSADGAHMYVLGELQSTVTEFDLLGTDNFIPVSSQKISALPQNFSGHNDAAEIALHPNGKFLYTSNRGNDSIAVFSVQRRRGTLKLVGIVPTGGKTPRHFAIDPSGNYLLVENQESNNIVIFEIDSATGALTPTGQVVQTPSPVDLTFVPAS